MTSLKFCHLLQSILDHKRDLIGLKGKWRWRPSTESAVWPSCDLIDVYDGDLDGHGSIEPNYDSKELRYLFFDSDEYDFI